MGFLDTIIGLGIVVGVLILIWSRIYNHEKAHIDPLIAKIKGWFIKEDEDLDPNEDFEVDFRGQI